MTEYTAVTPNEADTLVITTEAESAETLIEYDETDTTSQTVEIQWWTQENVVTISVTNGSAEKIYTVVVSEQLD